jgi:hypothetical protein
MPLSFNFPLEIFHGREFLSYFPIVKGFCRVLFQNQISFGYVLLVDGKSESILIYGQNKTLTHL